MRRLQLLVTVCAFVLALGSMASAAPIAYDESVSGDLAADISFPFSQVLALDAGVNTVSGTSCFGAAGCPDFDSFGFVVPPGTLLTGIEYHFTSLTTTGTFTSGFSGWDLLRFPSLVVESGATDVIGPNPQSPFTVILGPDNYGMRNGSLGYVGCVGGGCSWTVDYQWRLTVTSVVPEPTSLLLLGTGLLGAISARRWRQRKV